MAKQEYLFEEFDPVSKEQWLEKIAKDLKGKPLTDLAWQIDEDLTIDPLYHPDDNIGSTSIPRGFISNNDWMIGEDFTIENPALSNKKLLQALTNGVNAPRFIFTKPPEINTFQQLFKDVVPDYIHTCFKIIKGNKPEYVSLVRQYHVYLQSQNIKTGTLSGSFHFIPSKNENPEALLQVCTAHFPAFKCLFLHEEKTNAGSSLSSILFKADSLFQQVQENQLAHFAVSVQIGTSFFVEIAKLRALRILWANLIKAYGVSNVPLFIDAYIDPAAYSEDTHTNMIRSMTIAMSAVIGGVDRLTVLPADQEGSDFSMRIARNVQHLLKMESYMDRIIDPAEGSFYIEKLTRTIAEKNWELFRKG